MTTASYLFIGGSLHGQRLQLKDSTPWFHYGPPTMVHAQSPETDAMFDETRTIEIYERELVRIPPDSPLSQFQYRLWKPEAPEDLPAPG